MRKILLASGCSNTEENFYSELHPEMDINWKKWPELLADKLGMNYINLAKSGAGYEYIYTSLLNYITRNDTSNIGLVITAWGQIQRKDFQKGHSGRWTNRRVDPDGDVFSWMRRSLDYCVSFEILCKQYKLPFLHVQMLSPYQDWLGGLRARPVDGFPSDYRYKYPGENVEKDNKKIMKIIDSYENILDTDRFIGWPFAQEWAGFSLQKRFIGLKQETMISEIDHHPNAKGQQVIAEYIYEWLG